MRHESHEMHDNSLLSYESESHSFEARKRIILQVVKQHGPCTDRFICGRLGFSDMNRVRPRITELVKAGLLEECGRVTDEETGKQVRALRVKEPHASE